MELLLGLRLSPTDKMSVIKLNDVNLKENIATFRTKMSGEINLPADSFDLIYCGCLLENESSLESYGLKNGSMIHVLKKNESKNSTHNSSSISSETTPDIMSSVFKTFFTNPLLEIALRRLMKKPDVIENIISSTPGLSEDAVAIAILHDADLLKHFKNTEIMEKIAKLHPTLLEASHHIATGVHDEAHAFAANTFVDSPSNSSNPQAAASAFMDNMSEDEEMAGDSSQSSDSTQPSSSNMQSRTNSAANAAQLFAALSRSGRSSTSNEVNNINNASTPRTSHSRTNSNSGGIITFEMFHEAMQQAFASSPATSNAANTPQSSPSPAFANTSQNLPDSMNMQRQISIMHEMGLQNDAINLQALQITNGDVQAAIELVLSGFGDN